MVNELKRTIAVKATKKQMDDYFRKMGYEKGQNGGDYYYLFQKIQNDEGNAIGEATIAFYPMDRKIRIIVDRGDYPRGNKWQTRIELTECANFFKGIFNR